MNSFSTVFLKNSTLFSYFLSAGSSIGTNYLNFLILGKFIFHPPQFYNINYSYTILNLVLLADCRDNNFAPLINECAKKIDRQTG